MSIIQDQPTIHGKQDIYGSNSKIKTPKDSKGMQEFCRYGELLKHALPRTTGTVKTYL